MSEKFLTLEEVAAKLRMSMSNAYKNKSDWVASGVNFYRQNGNPKGKLLFKESEIDRMFEKDWRTTNIDPRRWEHAIPNL